MKLKRLTREDTNGNVSLVKKDIDFEMLSPVIAKIILEAVEQLSLLERKVTAEELIEIPIPIGTQLNLELEGKMIPVEIIGYQITKKEMFVLADVKGIRLKIPLKEALSHLKGSKKMGNVNAI